MYVNKGTLFAAAFDPAALEVQGTPMPVLDHVAYSATFGGAQFSFSGGPSDLGTMLYRSGRAAGDEMRTVHWLDSAGKTQPLLAKPGPYRAPHLSPDGQRLAFSMTNGSSQDIWIYEWRRDTMTRLTFGTVGSGLPNSVWSPDGRYIVSYDNGGMFSIRSDGAGKPEALTQSDNLQVPFSFTPDGKRLAWMESRRGYDLWTMPLETDAVGLRGGKPEVFLATPFSERQPAFSPDGRWIAYTSNESGTFQVYVAFPDKGGKWQISYGPGVSPVWSPHGHDLFFRSGNQIMATAWTVKGDSFVADKPRVWSEKRLADIGLAVGSYDVAPDGKRLVTLMPVETPEADASQREVIFLLNFGDELRRKVPLTGK